MKIPIVSDKMQALDASLAEEFLDSDSENTSYDFFKSLSSMSLLTLGGVLTLSEKVFSDKVDPWMMFVSGGFIAASGITALQCQLEIVQLSRGRPPTSHFLRYGHRVAPGLFGAGVGGFLVMLCGAYL